MNSYDSKEKSLYCHWDTHDHDVLFMNENELDQHLYSHFGQLPDALDQENLDASLQTSALSDVRSDDLLNTKGDLDKGDDSQRRDSVKDSMHQQSVECHWDSCHEMFNIDDIMEHFKETHQEESLRPHYGSCSDVSQNCGPRVEDMVPSHHAQLDPPAHFHHHGHSHGGGCGSDASGLPQLAADSASIAQNTDGSVTGNSSSSMRSVLDNAVVNHNTMTNKTGPFIYMDQPGIGSGDSSSITPPNGVGNEQNLKSDHGSTNYGGNSQQHGIAHVLNTPQMMPGPDSGAVSPIQMNNSSMLRTGQSLASVVANASNNSSSVSSPDKPRVLSYNITNQGVPFNDANLDSHTENAFSSAKGEQIGQNTSPTGSIMTPTTRETGVKIDSSELPRLNTPESISLETHRCMWATTTGHICGEEFLTTPELNAHIVHAHLKDGSTACKWEGCTRIAIPFCQKQKLVRHLQSHAKSKDHVCHVCKRQLSDDALLRSHMMSHTDERPHSCDRCGRGFRSRKSLIVHERTHTGLKPLVCPFPGCGKSFSESSNLAKHRKTHAEPEYECNTCKRRFTRRDHLVRHQRSKKHFDDEEVAVVGTKNGPLQQQDQKPQKPQPPVFKVAAQVDTQPEQHHQSGMGSFQAQPQYLTVGGPTNMTGQNGMLQGGPPAGLQQNAMQPNAIQQNTQSMFPAYTQYGIPPIMQEQRLLPTNYGQPAQPMTVMNGGLKRDARGLPAIQGGSNIVPQINTPFTSVGSPYTDDQDLGGSAKMFRYDTQQKGVQMPSPAQYSGMAIVPEHMVGGNTLPSGNNAASFIGSNGLPNNGSGQTQGPLPWGQQNAYGQAFTPSSTRS